MAVIFNYRSLCKSYGGEPLFSDIGFDLSDDERLGLIGTNGCGKSTLLKIIAGKERPDKGERYLKKHVKLVYLPQQDSFDPEKSIETILLDALDGEDIDDVERYQRVKFALGRGGFANKDQLCSELSGGWKKRLAVTRALALNPDLLLLDEPTNHLDLEGIIWLERILKNGSFAFVVVSHDRCFLENTVNKITELGRCYSEGYFSVTGGYDKFVRYRAKFIEEQLAQETVLSNKMRRETEWLRQGPKARSTKARYRIDQAEQMRLELYALKKRNRQTDTVSIDFDSTGRKTKKLITAVDLGYGIENRKLFAHIDLKLTPGSRLGLLGENGSGKTTFMRIVEGTLVPDHGRIERADKLKLAVFDQNRTKLDQDMHLKEALSPAGDSVVYKGRSIHVVSWAKRFLFTPDQLELPVGRLSGGEQARILIANLMLETADVLLLDEPTNDLDIPSLEILEESLLEFPGAVVLVTHDRFLLDRVTNSILYLDGKGSTEIFADYSQCVASDGSGKKEKKKTAAKLAKPEKKKKKFSFNDKFELEQIEGKILIAESDVETLQGKLEDPEVSGDPDKLSQCCTRLQKAQEKVETLYSRWEELESMRE